MLGSRSSFLLEITLTSLLLVALHWSSAPPVAPVGLSVNGISAHGKIDDRLKNLRLALEVLDWPDGFETDLLLQPHHLKSLEVSQILPPVLSICLLCPAALCPLLINLVFLPQSSHWSCSGCSGKFGDDKRCHSDFVELNGMSWYNCAFFAGRTVYQSLWSGQKLISCSPDDIHTRL